MILSYNQKKIGLFLCVFVFLGCTTLRQPAPKIHFYALEYPSPNFSGLRPIDTELYLRMYAGSSILDDTAIVYQTGPYTVDRYYYHKWQSKPEDMIIRNLIRDFQTSGLFGGVFGSGTIMKPPYIVEGRLDAFHEWDAEDGWKAMISITISLIKKDNQRKILFQKQYREMEKLATRNPEGLAAAMSAAFQKIATSIIMDVHSQILDDIDR